MSAIVARAEYFDELSPGYIVSTYAGYALGCAVANKVLDIFEEDDLVNNSARVGKYIEKVVEAYQQKHPLVGSYSVKGVFLGIEYVKDRTTKEPAADETKELVNLMRDAGLLAQLNGYYSNRISFVMPLIVKEKDIDEIFAILDRLTGDLEKKYNIS